MKSCKKPCLWSALIIVAVLLAFGGIVVWLVNNFQYWGDSPYREKEIRTARHPIPPLWSPGSAYIAFNADATLHIVDADGIRLHSFPRDEESSRYLPHRDLTHATSVSREGVIAYISNTPGSGALELRTASFDGEELGELTQGASDAINPTWSPNGEKIAFFQPASLKIIDVGSVGYDYIGNVARDDITLRYAQDTSGFSFSSGTVDPPAWSPNGRELAFIARCRGRCADPTAMYIYAIGVDGTNPRQLSETVTQPAWSPDGGRIAFMQHAGGISSIHTISPDGTDLRDIASFPDTLPNLYAWERRFDYFGNRDRVPRGPASWSKDGSEIRFHQSPFVVVNADGSNLRIMRGQPDALASWSPNDSQIAVSLLGRGIRLFTMDPDGSNKRSLVRWDNAAGEFRAERAMINIPGFDWESHPSVEVEQ